MYNVRRNQDSINPQTHADLMVLSHKDANEPDSHPYWYARVIGIYHVNIVHKDSKTLQWSEQKRMEFIFVQWFGWDTQTPGGWKAKKLHQIGFLDGDDPSAFGFVDPADIVHAVHLIPRFSGGVTDKILRHSFARSVLYGDEDYD